MDSGRGGGEELKHWKKSNFRLDKSYARISTVYYPMMFLLWEFQAAKNIRLNTGFAFRQWIKWIYKRRDK